jgi:hypothetical protein
MARPYLSSAHVGRIVAALGHQQRRITALERTNLLLLVAVILMGLGDVLRLLL